MLKFLEVPIASIIHFQKVEVNRDPQCEIILLGRLWVHTTWVRNPSANSFSPIISTHGTKWAIFIRCSMITQMVLEPSSLGSPVIKSMDINYHGLSGICRGYRRPNGVCLISLICL
jgi:hypothetical protein